MSPVPAIHRNTHLLFRPEPGMVVGPLEIYPAPGKCEPRGGVCVLCGGEDPDFTCERCAAPFHADCHLERALSADERALFLAAVAERDAAEAPRFDAAMLQNLATLAEALAVPLVEMLETLHPPGPAEQAVGQLTYLCQGCRS